MISWFQAFALTCNLYRYRLDYLLASSCLVVQSAYDGCGSCECAMTNTCTTADLGSGSAATPACADCQAWASDICKHFDFDGRGSSLVGRGLGTGGNTPVYTLCANSHGGSRGLTR